MNHSAEDITVGFNPSDAFSIYEYSRFLIGQSLHSLLGEKVIEEMKKGKGGLGQMVEELFFKYKVNSCRKADFEDANLELKCTPLLKAAKGKEYRIKERLVCSMIDYFELAQTRFEDSHLLAKCRLMLFLFYLHEKDKLPYDFEFLFRVLWELPEKDLLLIKKDYETIADKVRRGEAHLLSEGDTIYLGACRKGQKGDNLQNQPYSDIKAKKRAFSLKPAYMRYVLSHLDNGANSFCNYSAVNSTFELASMSELENKSFEDVIKDRFKPFIGMDYTQICSRLGVEAYQSKSKYADVCGLIASNNVSKRLSKSEEFLKSGITMKTVRLRANGMPCESMSFNNIDYFEVYDNNQWIESELYEIFTTRFLFVIFRPAPDSTICLYNTKKKVYETEQKYILDKVFFWTMPSDDLELASVYWEEIRQIVLQDKIALKNFRSIADHKKFHVRPKAANSASKTSNPNGGLCDKYCYWFNAEYVKEIIDGAK